MGIEPGLSYIQLHISWLQLSAKLGLAISLHNTTQNETWTHGLTSLGAGSTGCKGWVTGAESMLLVVQMPTLIQPSASTLATGQSTCPCMVGTTIALATMQAHYSIDSTETTAKMTVWTMRKVMYLVHLIITACTQDMRITRGFQYIYNNYTRLQLFIIRPQEFQEAYRCLYIAMELN